MRLPRQSCAHGDHVTRLQRHSLAHIGDAVRDFEDHVGGVVGLPCLAIYAGLDLQSHGAARKLIGRHEDRPKPLVLSKFLPIVHCNECRW
jgi:hypothetical protein